MYHYLPPNGIPETILLKTAVGKAKGYTPASGFQRGDTS